MEKFTRNQRVTAITKLLVENPNKIVNLNTFTNMLNAAKSTISEDLLIVKDTLNKLSMGKVETISGVSGGVKYICGISKEESKNFTEEFCKILSSKDRIVPGDFLYMTDIMCNPQIIHKAGTILASAFNDLPLDYVVTVETKGIPLAFQVANMLGVQLVIVRRDNKLNEGPTVGINYISGSNKRIQNMSISKKAMKEGGNCIFIDDFMRAGGTAFGIIDLLKEFNSKLLGIGVLVDNVQTPKKLVHDYISIVDLNGIDENGAAILSPSKNFR